MAQAIRNKKARVSFKPSISIDDFQQWVKRNGIDNYTMIPSPNLIVIEYSEAR